MSRFTIITISAFMVLFATFMLAPLAVVLIAAATADNFVQFPPATYGLRWILEVLTSGQFLSALLFSTQISLVVGALAGILGVSSAMALENSKLPGREALIGIITLPLALPHIVLAVALLYLFGMIAIPSSPVGIVVGHVLITTPYVLRLTLTSLRGLDQRLMMASSSLGASNWSTFRYVVLPSIAPGVCAGLVFAVLLSFDEVTISFFMSQPGRATLPAEIFAYAQDGSSPIIAAASAVMIAATGTVVILIERYFGVLRLIADSRT